MSDTNDPLRGTVVLVRADVPYDPLDKQNQFGVVCESNLLNDDIFVDFTDKIGLYSADSLLAFIPAQLIQQHLADLPPDTSFNELKALTQIGLFLQYGGVVGELKAMAIARDNPAIQPLCTDILQNLISHHISNQYGRD